MFAIKKMRERAGLSQQEAADGIDVTLRRYGNWEREDREINLREAIRLADLFGCSLDELAGRASASVTLTPPEREVVDAYRSTSDNGRAILLSAARGALGMGAERAPGADSRPVSA